MHAVITSHQPQCTAKDLPTMLYCFHRLPMFVGLLEDRVARHHAPVDLVEDDVSSKLILGTTCTRAKTSPGM